jgi:hypothetical protein
MQIRSILSVLPKNARSKYAEQVAHGCGGITGGPLQQNAREIPVCKHLPGAASTADIPRQTEAEAIAFERIAYHACMTGEEGMYEIRDVP